MAVGCSSEEALVKVGNSPPAVTFTFRQIAVARDRTSPVILTVTTDDADGDAVTVNWRASRGLVNAADQGKTSMRWTVVNATGTDTITVTAEDGKGAQTVIKPTIRVVNRLTDVTQANTVWSKADSPYLLDAPSGTFSIDPGLSLTIEAGVELIINKPDLEFLVQGTLTTQGTSAEPVIFGFNDIAPETGVWAGVTASPDQGPPQMNLNYTYISHAATGIKALRSSVASIKNCKITFCSEAAIYHQGNSALEVIDCTITNNDKSGIRIDQAVGTGLPAFVTIQGDSIGFNGDLSGETAYTAGEAGISINLTDPTASTVPISIQGNHIAINGFPGIRLTGGAFPTINGNAIFGNERNKTPGPQYNLRLEPGFDGPGVTSTMDATNNYWAQLDAANIELRIYDRKDNVTIETTVNYTPWLTSEP